MKTCILTVFFFCGILGFSTSYSQQAMESWPVVSKLQFLHSGSVLSIQWVADAEPQQLHYEVESSTDGIIYKTVAIVLGGVDEPGSYSYLFRAKAHSTKTYYRIKQVKQDGSFRIAAERSV
jgi:hypothetical protein